MMSAAMLMMASVEQTSVRPVSADPPAEQGTTVDVSFAKSFSDRVGERALLPENISAEEGTIASPGLKVAAPAKKLDEAPKTLEGTKEKSVARLEISGQGGRKSAAASILEPQSPALSVSQEKIAASNPGSKDVEPTGEDDLTADDGSPDFSARKVELAAGLTEEVLVAPVNISDEDRPLVLPLDSPISQKETESSGMTKEIASAKKPVKAQENLATSKAVQKAAGTEGNTASKTTASIVREDVVPIFQGVGTNVVLPQNDFGKAASDGSINAIVGMASASSEVSFARVPGSIQKESGHRTKANAVDAETAVTSAEAPPELAKSDAGLEKTAAAAIPTGSSGDGKVQSAFVPATGVVHSISGSAATSSAWPTAVVPGNAPGELTATKLPVGEAGPHTTGLPVGSKEQDRPGAVLASTDEVPRMLTATPTALEVGIQNGTHGWLRVRAEMADGGVVNASVSAASSAGQEMLHRELPALTAYLQEEKVGVNAIVVHTSPAATAEARSSAGMDGAGGQTQQKGNEGGEQQQSVRKQILNGTNGTMTYQSLQGVDEDGSLSLATYASGGSWLSVRA